MKAPMQQAFEKINRSTFSFEMDKEKQIEWDVFISGWKAAVAHCLNIVETHRVPVGNSAAGEMAAEWTMEALREVRDEMVKLNIQPGVIVK